MRAFRRGPAAGASGAPSAFGVGGARQAGARRKTREPKFRGSGLVREARPRRPILRLTSPQRTRIDRANRPPEPGRAAESRAGRRGFGSTRPGAGACRCRENRESGL